MMMNRLISIIFIISALNNKLLAQKSYSILLEKYGEKAMFYALLGEKSIKKKIVRNLSYKDFELNWYQLDVYVQHNWGKNENDSNRLFRKFLHGGVYEKTDRKLIIKIIKNGETVNIKKLSSFLSTYKSYVDLRQNLSERLGFITSSPDFETKFIQKNYPVLFRCYCEAIYFWYSDCTEEINGLNFQEIGITAIINYLNKNKHLLKKLEENK